MIYYSEDTDDPFDRRFGFQPPVEAKNRDPPRRFNNGLIDGASDAWYD